MVDKELLEAIGQMLDTKLKPIEQRLDKLELGQQEIKMDLAELKEDHQATRDGVNALLDWAAECGNVIKLPLPKVK